MVFKHLEHFTKHKHFMNSIFKFKLCIFLKRALTCTVLVMLIDLSILFHHCEKDGSLR